MIGFLGLSFALNVADPIWESIDEPGHFQYVKFVAERHHLPSRQEPLPLLPMGGPEVNCNNTRCLGRGNIGAEPPLYYLLEAPLVLPVDLNSNLSWVSNPYFTWPNHPLRNGTALHTLSEAWPYKGMVLGVHIMRVGSALMVAAGLVAIYFMAFAIRQSRVFALTVVAIAALTPGVVLSSATVNNDNAGILTGSLALLFAVKTVVGNQRRRLWLGLYAASAGLAFAAKVSAYYLLPISLLIVLASARRKDRASRQETFAGIALTVLLTVIAITTTRSDVAVSIFSVQHTFTTMGTSWPCECLPAQPLWGALPNLFETYWGSYGWETFHLASPLYRPFLAVTLAAIAGLILATVKVHRSQGVKRWIVGQQGRAVMVLIVAFLTLLFAVNYRYWATHSDGGSTHGRFMFPVVAAVSVFLGLGLFALPWLLRLAGVLSLLATGLAAIVYSIYILPGSFGPTLPIYGDTRAAGVLQHLDVPFVTGMHIVGLNSLDNGPVSPGGTVHLRLFWETSGQTDFDYSAFVRLVSDDGVLLPDRDHGPGLDVGLLPSAWQPGEVIPDDWSIPIPASARAGEYKIEVGLYDYRNLVPMKTTAATLSAIVGTLTVGDGATSPAVAP